MSLLSDSDSDSVTFTPVTDIDPNVWYQVSEARVDEYTDRFFTSNFQVSNSTSGEVNVWPDNGDLWQFQPATRSNDTEDGDVDEDGGGGARYFLRSSVTGIKKQLGVCYHEDELSNGKTRPCLTDSDGSGAQQWDIANWGNDTYRLINVHNGTDYWLDVHRGNPPFMSDETDTDVWQPAQRWLLSSVSNVDDGGFSTVFTNLPRTDTGVTTTQDILTTSTSTTTSPTEDAGLVPESGPDADSSSDPSSSSTPSGGISVATAAGIGVGVGLGVILLAGLAFFFWRRRQRAAVAAPTAGDVATPTTYGPKPPSYDVVEAPDKSAWSASYGYDNGYQRSNYSSTPPQQLDSYPRAPPPHPAAEMPGDSGRPYEMDSGHHR